MTTSELQELLPYLTQREKEELDGLLGSGVDDVEISPSDPPFHAAQLRAWASTKPILALIAGWQSGKTVFLPPWLKREIKRRGPGDYGAFSATFRLLDKKLLPELESAFSAYAQFRAAKMQFRFTDSGSKRLWGPGWNGEPTTIHCGYAENPDSMESSTLKGAIGDEFGQRLVPEQSFRTLKSRLMVHRGRMVLATRPYEPGWMERMVKEAILNPAGPVEVINFPSWENPYNPSKDDPYWAEERAKMPLWLFQMLYEGIYTRPAGVIYDCFDFHRDTYEDFEIPSHWKRYPGMDFGPLNAAGIVIAEEPKSKELFAFYDYISPGRREMKGHAVEMRRAGALSVGAGGAHGEVGWRDSAAATGIWLDEPPVNDVEVQIQCVYEQVSTHNLKFARKGCAGTISDLENFSRKVDQNGEVSEKIAGHEPHRLAALRYLITKLRPPKTSEVLALTPAQRLASLNKRP